MAFTPRPPPDLPAEPGLKYFLDAFDYHGFANGTTRLKLTKSAMTRITVPLPPRAEQTRIADLLTVQLDALRRNLEAGDRLASRVKQVENRVLRAALNASTSVRLLPLSEILARPLVNGRSVPTRPGGFPVLRLTALRFGNIDLTARKEGDWSAAEAAPWRVREGDFLVARGNGSLALVGRGGLVPTVSKPVAFPDTMIRIRVDEGVMLRRYLRLIWDDRGTRQQIEGMAKTTAGIYKINQTNLSRVVLPAPDLTEQEQIVARVDAVSEDARRAVAGMSRIVAHERVLRASILRAAMAGVLLPQDGTDEPAEILLKRIADEHAARRSADGTRKGTVGKARTPRAQEPEETNA